MTETAVVGVAVEVDGPGSDGEMGVIVEAVERE